MKKKTIDKLISEIKALKIPGSYEYMGACSIQVCIPLHKGGELRFIVTDDDVDPEGRGDWQVDIYDGALPPCITGPGVMLG
jgi:hypothetical protein